MGELALHTGLPLAINMPSAVGVVDLYQVLLNNRKRFSAQMHIPYQEHISGRTDSTRDFRGRVHALRWTPQLHAWHMARLEGLANRRAGMLSEWQEQHGAANRPLRAPKERPEWDEDADAMPYLEILRRLTLEGHVSQWTRGGQIPMVMFEGQRLACWEDEHRLFESAVPTLVPANPEVVREQLQRTCQMSRPRAETLSRGFGRPEVPGLNLLEGLEHVERVGHGAGADGVDRGRGTSFGAGAGRGELPQELTAFLGDTRGTSSEEEDEDNGPQGPNPAQLAARVLGLRRMAQQKINGYEGLFDRGLAVVAIEDLGLDVAWQLEPAVSAARRMVGAVEAAVALTGPVVMSDGMPSSVDSESEQLQLFADAVAHIQGALDQVVDAVLAGLGVRAAPGDARQREMGWESARWHVNTTAEAVEASMMGAVARVVVAIQEDELGAELAGMRATRKPLRDVLSQWHALMRALAPSSMPRALRGLLQHLALAPAALRHPELGRLVRHAEGFVGMWVAGVDGEPGEDVYMNGMLAAASMTALLDTVEEVLEPGGGLEGNDEEDGEGDDDGPGSLRHHWEQLRERKGGNVPPYPRFAYLRLVQAHRGLARRGLPARALVWRDRMAHARERLAQRVEELRRVLAWGAEPTLRNKQALKEAVDDMVEAQQEVDDMLSESVRNGGRRRAPRGPPRGLLRRLREPSWPAAVTSRHGLYDLVGMGGSVAPGGSGAAAGTSAAGQQDSRTAGQPTGGQAAVERQEEAAELVTRTQRTQFMFTPSYSEQLMVAGLVMQPGDDNSRLYSSQPPGGRSHYSWLDVEHANRYVSLRRRELNRAEKGAAGDPEVVANIRAAEAAVRRAQEYLEAVQRARLREQRREEELAAEAIWPALWPDPNEDAGGDS